jgi:hypothetical protein
MEEVVERLVARASGGRRREGGLTELCHPGPGPGAGRTCQVIVTPHLIRWVSRQDHVEGFLMKQEYISAHTYKLNLNEVILKILQI